MKKEEKKEPKKKFKFKLFILIILGILIAIFFYGMFVGTTGLLIKETKIIDTELPDSFNGFKVIHFADLHFGRTVNKKELENIVNKINELEPDIVFFTGDLIDKDITTDEEMVTDLIDGLSMIKTTVGKYAIEGNHDFENIYFKSIMEESGFMLLINNYDIVYHKSLTPIYVGGVGDTIYDNDNLEETVSYFENNEDLYKILLVHEPDFIDEAIDKNFNLILAGHSHNGQVRLPVIGKIYTPYGAKKYYLPHYSIGNTEVYITSGIGCSSFDIRLFNRPSLNFYRIYNH